METDKKSTRELRKFGLTMAACFAVISFIFFWRQKAPGPYLASLAMLFLLAALVAPSVLGPIERMWMKLARVLSVASTFILITLAFYIVVTPTGLLIRLFGKDPMKRRFDRVAESYWIPVEIDGPCSRPDKPF